MSEKPSYLGLLNAVSVAETDAGQYLAAWAAVTPSKDVRAVINTIALRETEHGLAFAKRIDELGYRSSPRRTRRTPSGWPSPARPRCRTRRSSRPSGSAGARRTARRDVFDTFFENKDLDPVTGGLLGRYVAEERDSGRKFAECYAPAVRRADAKLPSRTAQGRQGQGQGEVQEEVAVGTVEPEGDAACWLDRVCDLCGGFVHGRRAARVPPGRYSTSRDEGSPPRCRRARGAP